MENSNSGQRVSEDELRDRLKRVAQQYGGVAQFASAIGVDAANLAKVIKGRRRPGPRLLQRLSVREERYYLLSQVKDDRAE